MLAIVVGTRPELIKLSPVMRACEQGAMPFYILHTGQHYSPSMDQVFFEQLELPAPKYNLHVGSGPHGRQTGQMLAGIEAALLDDRPDAVVVQGDTNSTLAGALAAAKLGIPVGHVEAGLRSYDRRMPEELNRIVIDQLSDWLFAPTPAAADILRREGIPDSRILVTGNTIVDAVQQNLAIAQNRSEILQRMQLTSGGYLLVTVHRPENVDHPRRFAAILDGLRKASAEIGLPLVYPMHPRSRKMLEVFSLDSAGLGICEPVSFLDFLILEAHARLVLTDSGGVQEEACILGVPCVTLRENTERPETLEVGANVLAGSDPEQIVLGCRRQMAARRGWQQPLGDGSAGQRIARRLSAGQSSAVREMNSAR
ncbi:MAG TPA: UDP-N-acetylglucosamine 2-epimerase (non-hydrolyzing) [Pirellulales bacterium]